MEKLTFACSGQKSSTLLADKDNVWFQRLFGMYCGNNGKEDACTQLSGMALISTGEGRFEGDDLYILYSEFNENDATIVWRAIDKSFQLHTSLSFCRKTGIISRKDKLENTNGKPLKLFRCLSRFVFSCGEYEVYAQQGRWNNENQGAWQSLLMGSMVFGTKWGRTSEGGTPYLGLREVDGDRGVVFHILPRGNWTIRVSSKVDMNSSPYALVELGLADEDLRMELQAGEELELPEILIQEMPEGKPHLAAPYLHEYINNRRLESSPTPAPVIYNTWLDVYGHIELNRLRKQLEVAKELGCEVFVIDAGWFGPDDKSADGWQAKGDWREKTDKAFFGKMNDFADEVRNLGLGFGLWMEPESFSGDAPVCKEHPEWFTGSRINLTNKEAYDYQFGEISRLIEAYNLVYMKMDMNSVLGYDESGSELYKYFELWYTMLDEIRRKYPQVFIENCASGAMRCDLSTVFHFDGEFISDTANPLDVLRISQGAFLRLPPGRILRWATLRDLGPVLPGYSGDSDKTLFVQQSATWDSTETVDLGFLMATCLPGALGFSGDISSLSSVNRERVKWYVNFYKSYKEFFPNAAAHLLTAPELITERKGWIAFQMQNADTNMVFVYHHANDGQSVKSFQLRDLDLDGNYSVKEISPENSNKYTAQGSFLMKDGLEVCMPTCAVGILSAAIYLIEKS